MTVLYIVLAAIALLLAACVLRAAAMKPTAQPDARLPETDSARSEQYGRSLGEMIRCRTVSCRDQQDRSQFYEYRKVLEKLFPNVFAVCEVHDFNGSLLLKWKGKTDGEPIMLMSHQDVVEAPGKWEHEPFGGEMIDGAVWGRGTVDTKGSAFCFFQAAEELIKQGFRPETDVYLGGSCTEEWSGDGGPAMAAWLEENGVKLGLLLDEGGMILEEPIAGAKGMYAMVGVLEKGYGDVKFSAKSAGGHASAPGKNTPWARLAKFIARVEKKTPFRTEFNDTTKEMFRRVAPNMSFPMRLALGNIWLLGPVLKKVIPSISPAAGAMMRTTIAFTTGKGSNGYNVLPQEAYVTGNMRFIQHQPTGESLKIISELAKKYDIDTEVIVAEEPCPVVSFKSRQFALVEQLTREIYPGVCVSPYAMTGGTDAKYYSRVCDNCLRFAPLYINNQQYAGIHGLNENINASSLVLGVDFYKELIKSYK